MDEAMRAWMTCLLAVSCLTSAQAHHPNHERKPVRQRYDLIGPIGNRLPMEYRRRYNRPTNWGGKIAYHIAPSSQEAMRWHRATHQGQYKRGAPRMVAHYFYPKPWESIRIGARPERDVKPNQESAVESIPPGYRQPDERVQDERLEIEQPDQFDPPQPGDQIDPDEFSLPAE